VEPIAPGEGEVTAAQRLLERVLQNHSRLIDVVVADALYFEAPFFNFCIHHKKEVLAVLKGDRRLLLQDARGLLASIRPKQCEDRKRHLRLWDEDGFTSAEGIEAPLRVVRCEETLPPRKSDPPGHPSKVSDWWWVTTIPKKDLPARQVAQIGHARWDIENDLFNDLSAHWGLDHPFKHHPAAILNFVLTLFIAFILLKSFHLLNVKDSRLRRLSLIAVAEELKIGLDDPDGFCSRRLRTDLPSP
jgi:hypothetical protein